MSTKLPTVLITAPTLPAPMCELLDAARPLLRTQALPFAPGSVLRIKAEYAPLVQYPGPFFYMGPPFRFHKNDDKDGDSMEVPVLYLWKCTDCPKIHSRVLICSTFTIELDPMVSEADQKEARQFFADQTLYSAPKRSYTYVVDGIPISDASKIYQADNGLEFESSEGSGRSPSSAREWLASILNPDDEGRKLN